MSAALRIVALVLAIVVAGNQADAARRVVVLHSDSTRHTLRTISGVEWSLKGCDPPCSLIVHFLRTTDDGQRAGVLAIKPDLLISVGSHATAFAAQHLTQFPVIFAKVLNPIESGFIPSWDKPGSRMTGAALDIPVEQQIKRFMEVLPRMKRVGVIYTPATARLVDEARKACANLNLKLLALTVNSIRDLPAAVDSLCKSVDGIWTVADEQLSSPQFVRHTLMETLRCGVPIMGFNQNFVENGALFCLEADYKFIGRQAGEMALAVLSGREVNTIKPTTPDVVYLYLNLKSSKLLKIDLSQELISVAKETY